MAFSGWGIGLSVAWSRRRDARVGRRRSPSVQRRERAEQQRQQRERRAQRFERLVQLGIGFGAFGFHRGISSIRWWRVSGAAYRERRFGAASALARSRMRHDADRLWRTSGNRRRAVAA